MTKIKKILITLGIIVVIASVVAIGFVVKVQVDFDELKSTPLNLSENFTYTAHAGCVGTPDDSLESIDVGVKYGAPIVEIDLNFNENNEPVLSHDTPDGDEVTLDAAFERIAGYENLRVNIDVKSTANLEEVAVLADKYGITDRIFFTGVKEEFVAAVHGACPDVPHYLNVDVLSVNKQDEEYILSLVQKVKDSGAIGINFNKGSASQALVDIFHENGLLVSIWTVNKEKEIYKILALSPDNITTRQPDIVSEVLNNE